MISASLVKELRDKTGAGMMDCKKALEECEADIVKAVDWLREKGIAKAANKAGRIAAEGLTKIASANNTAIIVEINSETDFVAKNEQFLSLINDCANEILVNQPSDLEAALKIDHEGKKLEEMITEATVTIGEKISLRRFAVVEKNDSEYFGLYTHFDGRIAVITIVEGGGAEVAKDVAMQIASMNPNFISRADIDESFITHEREIQLGIVANDPTLANKPEKVILGIVEGRLSKSLQEICLNDQLFFKNPDQKVAQYLKENNALCKMFVRYAVGEGMEKKEDNFAAEVASMI